MTGRIDYSPDYKSEKKRKPLNPEVRISANGRPFIDVKEGVRRILARRAPDSPPEDIAALKRIERDEAPVAERTRLRDAVVEAAKTYRIAVREHAEYVKECMAQDPSQDNDEDPKWEAQLGAQCVAEHALSEAVDALLEFESSQENKG